MKYSHWKSVANANFSSVRRSIFRHAMFINTYDEDTSSGIANDIPGQYFIVANQEWLRNTGDVGVAGTFMHELGHTLGLCHGGFDDGGNNNHIQYKPNYLSIMNYLFQTRGLAGTDELNYSEYTLPTIDEGNLIESNGIDPQYMTANTGLGTYLIYGGELIDNVSGKGIDFNGDGIISASSIRYNVNHDTDNNDNPIFGKSI